MRIVIDTKIGRIVVPQSFFKELDKINKILADGGANKRWTAEEYIKDQFEKALKETILRPGDTVN